MSIPETMRAVIVERPGGPEALKLVERAVPQPDHHEVLIKVAAAGLNGADVGQRLGRYRMPPGAPDVFGLEASGDIVAVAPGSRAGASATGWRRSWWVAAMPSMSPHPRGNACRCRKSSRWWKRRRCRNA